MTPYFANLNYRSGRSDGALTTVPRVTIQPLKENDEAETIRFLQERALHNAVMSGFIRDHGMESALNRGTFYGAREENKRLQGVALIGHATFMDARNDAVINEFAQLAQAFPRIHMVLGENKPIEQFWRSYADGGQPLRRRCREMLLEVNEVAPHLAPVPELQPATLANLNHIAAVQAALAHQESGTNPLTLDPSGFLLRCRQRIERERVWAWIHDGQLIFKADLISETPEVIYLEGIYVNPNDRNKGLGARCTTQLARQLLNRARSIVVLVNETRADALRFFQGVGFVARGVYQSLFLEIRNSGDQH